MLFDGSDATASLRKVVTCGAEEGGGKEWNGQDEATLLRFGH